MADELRLMEMISLSDRFIDGVDNEVEAVPSDMPPQLGSEDVQFTELGAFVGIARLGYRLRQSFIVRRQVIIMF